MMMATHSTGGPATAATMISLHISKLFRIVLLTSCACYVNARPQGGLGDGDGNINCPPQGTGCPVGNIFEDGRKEPAYQHCFFEQCSSSSSATAGQGQGFDCVGVDYLVP